MRPAHSCSSGSRGYCPHFLAVLLAEKRPVQRRSRQAAKYGMGKVLDYGFRPSVLIQSASAKVMSMLSIKLSDPDSESGPYTPVESTSTM